jgi:hypothetical protein
LIGALSARIAKNVRNHNIDRFVVCTPAALRPGRARVWSAEVAATATIEGVREVAQTLPRSYEVLVRDRVKFRVGRIVYLAFSRDETELGFAFPKEEREALVTAMPTKFRLPDAGDLRYNWVVARLSAIDDAEMAELVVDAWRMVVPKRVAAGYLRGELDRP